MSCPASSARYRAAPDLAALEPRARARVVQRLAGERELGRAELHVVAPRALGVERVGEGRDDVARLDVDGARGGEDLRGEVELARGPRRVAGARVELRGERERRAHAAREVRRQARAGIVGAEGGPPREVAVRARP